MRALAAAAILFALLQPAPVKAEGLLIIANPSVESVNPIPLEQVSAIYLLRITTWPDGSHIIPVNREASSTARVQFTSVILKLNVTALTSYWNKMHFLGKEPPVVQESEQSMLAFIQKVPGAIGYISASTTPANVKVLRYVP